MTLDEMRSLDSLKTYKELEDAKQHITELENRLRALWYKLEGERKYYQDRIKRLEEAGDYLCAAAAFMGWHDKIEDWNKAKEVKP